MAADSQASLGGSKMTLVSPNCMKMWRPASHPNMIMGGAGAFRDINILSVKDTWYDPLLDKAGEPLDFKFMVTEFVPTLLNELTANGRTESDNSGLSMNSQFLVAMGDRCYSIMGDGCVIDMTYEEEIMAIGSGSDIALAAYRAMEGIPGLSIKERIIRAMAETCESDLYVNFPVYIMDTESQNIDIYDGQEIYVATEEGIKTSDFKFLGEGDEAIDNLTIVKIAMVHAEYKDKIDKEKISEYFSKDETDESVNYLNFYTDIAKGMTAASEENSELTVEQFAREVFEDLV